MRLKLRLSQHRRPGDPASAGVTSRRPPPGLASLFRRALLCAAPLLAFGLIASAALAEGRISIIVNDPENPYWAAEGEVAKATAAELGYRAIVSAHGGDTTVETAHVDSAIAANVDAIILDPADASGTIAAVERAVAAGVPVFVVNSGLARKGLAVAQLLSNNAQGAEMGAQRWLRSMGEKGSYIELLGAASDPNASIRSDGYASVLGQYEGLTRAGMATANWNRTQGYERTRGLIADHPEITGIIAGNDEMALGAIAALKEAGLLDRVTVGGFDGSPDAVAAVQSGELAYTVLQPVAVFAEDAVHQADHYIRTGTPREPQEVQLFDCLLIDRANAAKMSAPFVMGQ